MTCFATLISCPLRPCCWPSSGVRLLSWTHAHLGKGSFHHVLLFFTMCSKYSALAGGHWQCLSAFQQAFYCQYHLEWNQHRAADNQSSKHFTQLDCHDWCSTWKTQTDKGMEKRYNYNYNNLLFYVLFLQIRSCSPSQSEEQNTAWACSHTRTDGCMHKHI